jgi:hypothetical protein
MIRKIAACAVIAIVPGFALAAGVGANVSSSADTHAVGANVKADAAVKSDAAAKTDATAKTDAAVKTDAVAKTGKVVHHPVAHKVKDDKSKSSATPDSTPASPKL